MFDFPSSPLVGQQFTPYSGGPTYVWQPPVWRLASGGISTGVYVGESPPLSPVQGTLWFNSATGNSFIYFSDVDSSAWIQFNIATPITDHISSVGIDMYAGFKTAGNFTVNDKVGGDGTDLFRVQENGSVYMQGTANVALTLTGGAASTAAYIVLDKALDGNYAALGTKVASNWRWLMQLGNSTAESGSNVGSDFQLSSYNDVGNIIATSMLIPRASANPQFAPTRITDTHGNGNITWHAAGCASVIDYGGPGSNYGMLFSNRLTTGTSTAVLFKWVSGTVGSITVTASATAYVTTSDIRLKEGFKEPTDARALVDALQVVEWAPPDEVEAKAVEGTDPATDVKWLGIPAQQAYGVYPPAVVPPDIEMPGYKADAAPGDEGFMPWGIDYSKFVPMLLANVQELNARNDALEARLAALEGTRR